MFGLIMVCYGLYAHNKLYTEYNYAEANMLMDDADFKVSLVGNKEWAKAREWFNDTCKLSDSSFYTLIG